MTGQAKLDFHAGLAGRKNFFIAPVSENCYKQKQKNSFLKNGQNQLLGRE